MTDFKYRPDVDGLRAVAVILVLLFHAGLGFSGGFIGVDVFFVISGFLITGLILKEQESGKFSLANFWVRRIRRIIPAATVVVVAVLVAGFFILLPADYQDLGKSTIAQQLMLSNVYFWRNTGYFDGPADLKPLLHTWSLAVEEQFYLGYPFLMMFLHRFGRKVTFVTLALLGVGSLIVSVYGVEHYPSATFFLLPTRAWELLIGGLICFLPKPTRVPSWLLASVSWLSLPTILVVGWFYTSTTPFPGLAALVPCIATAAFIFANSIRLSSIAKVISTKPFVSVGLISYSLYLWHWPILSFLRYRNDGVLGTLEGVLALCLSAGAAYLSWLIVETPIRKRDVLGNTRRVVFAAAAASTVCVTIAFSVFASNGFARFRYGDDYLVLIRSMDEKAFRHIMSVQVIEQERLPKFGETSAKPSVLVWGDSHAMAIMPAVDQVCKEAGLCGVQATTGGTLPLIGFSNSRPWSETPAFAEKTINYCKQHDIKIVVMAGYWSRDAADPLFESCMLNTIRSLRSMGIEVLLVRDVPDQKCDPPKAIHQAMRDNKNVEFLGEMLSDHRVTQSLADAVLLQMATEGAMVLDPASYLSDETGRCRLVIEGKCMYWDNDHLTVSGAHRLIPLFRRAFAETQTMVSRNE